MDDQYVFVWEQNGVIAFSAWSITVEKNRWWWWWWWWWLWSCDDDDDDDRFVLMKSKMLTFRMIEIWIKDTDTYNIHTGLILSIQSGTSHPDNFITFAIDLRLGISFSVKNVTDSPVLPARPILYINHAYHYHHNHLHHYHHHIASSSSSSSSSHYIFFIITIINIIIIFIYMKDNEKMRKQWK